MSEPTPAMTMAEKATIKCELRINLRQYFGLRNTITKNRDYWRHACRSIVKALRAMDKIRVSYK